MRQIGTVPTHDDIAKEKAPLASGAPARPHAAWRRRLAMPVLLITGLVVYATLGPKVPKDHEIAIDLGAAAPDIAALELAWTAPDTKAAQVTTQWNFERGKAPSQLRTRVRLADGEWLASVEVQRWGQLDRTTWSRRVYVEGTQVVLPLREALR
jgi:hypothetical protein